MRYVLNGPSKEYRNKRRTDKMKAKLNEKTLLTLHGVHTNKTKHENKV